MKALTELKHSLEEAWGSLSQGWRQIRERTEEALTHFKPHQNAEVPANRASAEDPFPLRAPMWGLLSGEVFEDDNQVVVRLEAPGLEKQDFNIDVHGQYLTVRGEKRFRRENEKGRYRLLQCAYGSFQRSVALPVAVKAERAQAEYRNGVLRIVLPKADSAKAKARQIEVKEVR